MDLRKIAILVALSVVLIGSATAALSIENIEVSPENPEKGEEFSVAVTAEDRDHLVEEITLTWTGETPSNWDTDQKTKSCEPRRDECTREWTGIVFEDSGDYNFEAEALNGNFDFETQDGTVTIQETTTENQPPTADFTFSPSDPQVEEEITFDASASSDEDGSIQVYDWDLDGDGNYDDATGVEVTHSFESEGSHDVSLKVTDDKTASDTETKTVTVGEETTDQPPTADFTISPTTPEPNETVTFDASGSTDDNGIDSYEWDLDADGNYEDATGETATKTFSSAGDYEISLNVTDTAGNSDSLTRTVTVSSPGDSGDGTDQQVCEVVPGFLEVEPEVLRKGSSTTASMIVFNQGDDQRVKTTFRTDYGAKEEVAKTIPGNSQRSFSASFSPEQDSEISAHVKTVDGGPCGQTDLGIQTKDVDVFSRESEKSTLKVIVEDRDGDYIRNARVLVENGEDKIDFTSSQGESSFVLDSDTYHVTVSKSGFDTETKRVYLSDGQDETLTFVLEGESADDGGDEDGFDQDATLEVNVEDEESNSIEGALVEVQNGDDESSYTDSDGVSAFSLEPEGYSVVVSKTGYYSDSQQVELEPGENEQLDFTLETKDSGEDDDQDDDIEEVIEISSASSPDSVCRGASLVADVTVSNTGDDLETVTLTGSGLGSTISAGSFILEAGESKTERVIFTNAEGSGTETFQVTASNRGSDSVSRTVDVESCAVSGGGTASGMSMELSPDRTRAGKTVKVSGFVDGVEGRKEVTIDIDGYQAAKVNTQPDGYYQTFIRPENVGDLTVTASTTSASQSRRLEVLPTTNVVYAKSPGKVFEGDSFEICGKVHSQVTPRVDLVKNGQVIDSKNDKGEVCFERTASGVDKHDYRIKAVARGYSSSAPTEVEVLEADSEIESFPDKIAAVESGDGIVKVTVYNNHKERRTYDLTVFGVPDHWTAQTEKEVILQPGERREVFFYVTPENEGVFNTELKVESEGDTIYREQVRIYSGGTDEKTSQSWLDRLLSRFFL